MSKVSIQTDKVQIKKKKWFEFETELIWTNIIAIIIFHIISLYYILTFPYYNNKLLLFWGMFDVN